MSWPSSYLNLSLSYIQHVPYVSLGPWETPGETPTHLKEKCSSPKLLHSEANPAEQKLPKGSPASQKHPNIATNQKFLPTAWNVVCEVSGTLPREAYLSLHLVEEECPVMLLVSPVLDSWHESTGKPWSHFVSTIPLFSSHLEVWLFLFAPPWTALSPLPISLHKYWRRGVGSVLVLCSICHSHVRPSHLPL